ncbi:phosphoribosyltransferase [Lentzea sp. NBRC 105346]|uniref:phosphoribosyltransferase n=1 Tax=Lentzea sp. NBRC 105346 TaxID=3032205 RepID=UPI0024A48BDC|nr:phosphoribosyltransferase family protein [Lentzea sp. NBRC 105346]GLZ31592.1 phosphoribosyltransferase [Lentzea sp. NBRC 105346]
MRFSDRADAGQRLGELLARRAWTDPVVLGLPRGGVPVARAVADAIGAELDVVVARKIGVPGHPEYGVGAVTADGDPIYDDRALRALGLTREGLRPVCEQERAEARRRMDLYRADRPALRLAGRDVIIVDDGLATGVTAHAAVEWVRGHEPARIVLAVPVAAADSMTAFTDEVVAVHAPHHFGAVSRWYDSFDQVADREVQRLL